MRENVQHLRELLRWRAAVRPVDWAPISAALGAPLPSEFRELVEAFPPGTFQTFLEVIHPADFEDADQYRQAILARAGDLRDDDVRVALFPDEEGLIPWGTLGFSPVLCWRPQGPDPDRWPIVVCEPGVDDWREYHLPTAAFVAALITKPGLPDLEYVADEARPPFFEPLHPVDDDPADQPSTSTS